MFYVFCGMGEIYFLNGNYDKSINSFFDMPERHNLSNYFSSIRNYYCDLCHNSVSEAKHDCYCTDYNGTNWDKCDIYKKYS